MAGFVEAAMAYEVENMVIRAAKRLLESVQCRGGQQLKRQLPGLLKRSDGILQIGPFLADVQSVIVQWV